MDRAEDVVVVLEGGEDHDPDARGGGEHLSGGGDPVEIGHPYVHQYDVGRERVYGADRGAPVGGLADHLAGGV